MWILNHLKYVLNSTFASMMVSSPQKGKFYLIFFLVFGLISSLLSLFVSWLFLVIKYPNVDFNNFLFAGDFSLLTTLVTSSSVVIIAFLVNHYKIQGDEEGEFSMSQLLRNTTISVWFFYLITVCGISLYYAFFYFSDAVVRDDPNTLNYLLATYSLDGNYYLDSWKKGLVWYSLMYVPIILLSFNIIRQKLEKLNMKGIAEHWRHILTFILLYIILSSAYMSIYGVIDSLLLNLIRIPFEENYISTLITLIVSIVLNAIFFMVISKMAFYCFFSNEEIKVRKAKEESVDLLDQ